MSDFHAILRSVHGELWEAGPDGDGRLQTLLDDLVRQPLPDGITRLPSACMGPGPHLAPQLDGDPGEPHVSWLDAHRCDGRTPPGRLRL